MKNCIRPHYEKLKSPKSGFIENLIFENNRDPCREVKDKSELLHLPEKMAKWPACAQSVFLEDNKEADNSQVNRDQVEEGLEETLSWC